MNTWTEVKFSDLLEEPIKNGLYKPKEYHGLGTKIINMGELFAYPRLVDVPMERISLTENEKAKFLIKNGDLIFARRSLTAEGAGKCSIILNIGEETVFESSIIRARPDNLKASSLFLFYFFSSRIGKYLLGSILRQVAVAGITGSDLAELTFKIPPLPEQRAIASVLSSLDDKIDLLRRQNATLEAMAEALFKQWFVVEAKEEWEEYTVEHISKQLTDTINPLLFSDLLFNLYSIPAYDLNKNPEQSYGKNILSNKFKIDANCLLVSKLNPKVPRIWLLLENNLQNSIASTEFIPIVPFDKQNLPFLYCLFSSDRVIQELTNAASGTSGSHQRVRPDDILNITFMTPSLKYISEFSNLILPFFKKISFNHIRIFTLEKLRDTLLPKLMSGEVRVKF